MVVEVEKSLSFVVINHKGRLISRGTKTDSKSDRPLSVDGKRDVSLPPI